MASTEQHPDYWYDHRDELEQGMVFTSYYGIVKLDRSVPGDGTKWYVADFDARHGDWAYYDSTIEPGDLKTRLPDNYAGEPIAA